MPYKEGTTMDLLIDNLNYDKFTPEIARVAGSVSGGVLLTFLIGLANLNKSDECEVSSAYVEERTALDSRQIKYFLDQLKSRGLITSSPMAYNSGRKITLHRDVIRTALDANMAGSAKSKQTKDAFYKTLNETLSFHDLDALLDVKDNLDEVIVATLHYFALGFHNLTGAEWTLTSKDMGFLLQRQGELNRPMTIPSIASYFRSNPKEPSLYGWWKFLCLLPEDSNYPQTREEWDRLFDDDSTAENTTDVSDFFADISTFIPSSESKTIEPELKQFSRMNGIKMEYYWGFEPKQTLEAQFA